MGVVNIHIFAENDDLSFRIAQAALTEKRIIDHNRGKHSWGSMYKDCPLCQQGKELMQR